jgi:glycosyltransferase involved in cell wall biosynthesis
MAWRLIVVGRGDMARFQRVAADVGAAAGVQFVGWADPALYYAAADPFVFPTRYEAFPSSRWTRRLRASRSFSRPSAGRGNLLIDRRNGRLIERSAGNIAERLRQPASDTALSASMGGRQGRRGALRLGAGGGRLRPSLPGAVSGRGSR